MFDPIAPRMSRRSSARTTFSAAVSRRLAFPCPTRRTIESPWARYLGECRWEFANTKAAARSSRNRGISTSRLSGSVRNPAAAELNKRTTTARASVPSKVEDYWPGRTDHFPKDPSALSASDCGEQMTTPPKVRP